MTLHKLKQIIDKYHKNFPELRNKEIEFGIVRRDKPDCEGWLNCLKMESHGISESWEKFVYFEFSED